MLTRVSRGSHEGVGCWKRLEGHEEEEEGLRWRQRVYGRVKLQGISKGASE